MGKKTFFGVCLVGWGGRKINGGAQVFSSQTHQKVFSPKWRENWREKMELLNGWKCRCSLAHGLHPYVALFHFIFSLPLGRCLLFYFFFLDITSSFLFFFFFFLLIYRAGFVQCTSLIYIFFCFLLCVCVCVFFFFFFFFVCVFRCDFFFLDMIFLINLGHCLLFLVVVTFLVLIRHHFLTRVYE